MKRALLALALCFALPLMASAQFGAYTPPPPDDPNHPDTNSKEVQEWFSSLQNRIGGGCCGVGDKYEAIIDEEAAPGHPGRGHVIPTDRGVREVWVKGYLVVKRPALADDESGEFEFDYDLMTKEKLGNPLKTAVVFLDITNGKIDRNPTFIYGVYCVVPLPPGA